MNINLYLQMNNLSNYQIQLKYLANISNSQYQALTYKISRTHARIIILPFHETVGKVIFSIHAKTRPNNPRKTHPMIWTLDLLIPSLSVQRIPLDTIQNALGGLGESIAPNDSQYLLFANIDSSPARTTTDRATKVPTTTPPISIPSQIDFGLPCDVVWN